MRSILRLSSGVLAATALVLVSAPPMFAHPGHAHTDIPSLIRHPFAGPQHFFGSLAVGLTVAGLIYLVTRRLPVPALARWSGLAGIACAVAWTVGLST